jgi:hypothetical protein
MSSIKLARDRVKRAHWLQKGAMKGDSMADQGNLYWCKIIECHSKEYCTTLHYIYLYIYKPRVTMHCDCIACDIRMKR